MNYKTLPKSGSPILNYNEKSADNDKKVEYNMSLLNEALKFLIEYHDEIEGEESQNLYEEPIERCLQDIYYGITSGKQEIFDFIESHQINELIIDFFSKAKIFLDGHSKYSYGLLKCINGIIRNYPNASNQYLSQVIFQQFQMLNPNLISHDDEIKYLSLFFDTFHQIFHESNVSYFDESFFQHLLNFQGIDNEIDSQIVLIFNNLYLTLQEYPDCLIQCTKHILTNAPFHTYFYCAELFNTISEKIPEFLTDIEIVHAFNRIFNKSKAYSQFKTCSLLLKSLIIIPYSISCNYIDKSINGFIADSITQLATINLPAQHVLTPNSDLMLITFLNYLLENDGDTYINIFFNQEEYDLLDHLISIMQNQAYVFREVSCWTFVFLIKAIIQTENNTIYYRFIGNNIFPEQFAILCSLVLNVDMVSLRNELLNYILLFLDKARAMSAEIPFLLKIADSDIIQTIVDDDELDKNLTEILINQYFPDLNSS